MSRHENYIYAHRVKRLRRAVGFGGEVEKDRSTSRETQGNAPKGYYYFGPSNKDDSPNIWALALTMLLPIIILVVMGISPWVGVTIAVVALALIALYIRSLVS